MSTIQVTPKDYKKGLAALKSGDTLTFTEGNYPGSIYIRDKNDLTIVLQGASIVGNRGMKFERCNRLIFRGWGEIRQSTYHGLMVVDSVGLDVLPDSISGISKQLQFHLNALSGILTGNVSDANVSNTRCNNNGGHGIYFSQSGDDYNISSNHCNGNARCGIQVNAIQSKRKKTVPRQDSISKRVIIRWNVLTGNQHKYGAAGINMAGTQRCSILDNKILAHAGRHGIALWDDGTGRIEFACHDFEINNNVIDILTAKAKAGIDIGKGCTRIKVGSGNQYKGYPEKIWVVSHA